LGKLSQLWYQDRMRNDFRGRTLEDAQMIFASVGLTSDFWQS
jgi:hypothetical protein